MSRLISTESPGKLRRQYRRTIAEALRRLSQKQQMDDEVKDLAALIVYCLHGITDTVEQTMLAWEKRDYYIKAERFRQQWIWVAPSTEDLSAAIYHGRWDQLPLVLAKMIPHFSDIQVKQMTRKATLWQGAYDKFMSDD